MGICGKFLSDINEYEFERVLNDFGIKEFTNKYVLKQHFKKLKDANKNDVTTGSSTPKRKNPSRYIIEEFDEPFSSYGMEETQLWSEVLY